MSIGPEIKKVRLGLKLTTRILAVELGVSRSYLTLVENSRRRLPKKLVSKLAGVLKLPEETVYEWYLEQELTRAGIKGKESHDLIKRVLKMTIKEKESLLTILKIGQR